MGDSTLPDAQRYSEVLLGATEGYAFYTPYAQGAIGDCGIMLRTGQFVKLFNCFTDGIGGDRLPTPEPDPGRIPLLSDLEVYPEVSDTSERRVEVRPNKDVAWRAHKGVNWSVELELPIPLPSCETGFGFQASGEDGAAAFLVPCGESRRVAMFLKNKMFPSYLSRHHKDIHARFGSEYDTRTVYIIEGTTHAASWCRGLTRRCGRTIKGFVSVSPMAGLPGFRVGGGNGQYIDHPWTIEPGPKFQPPDGRLHLISAELSVRRSRRPDFFRPKPCAPAQDAESRDPRPQGANATSNSSRPPYSLDGATRHPSAGLDRSPYGVPLPLTPPPPWDSPNLQSQYNPYHVPQAAALPSQYPFYYSPQTFAWCSPFRPMQSIPNPIPLSIPVPYPDVSVRQRHTYPSAAVPGPPYRPAVSGASFCLAVPDSGSSQLAVIAPGGNTLASSDRYRESKHSMQRGYGISRAETLDHQCPHCGKRFDFPTTLKTHINSHTGTRPHTCTVPGCGRQFSVLSNMYRHAKACAAQAPVAPGFAPLLHPPRSPVVTSGHLSAGLGGSAVASQPSGKSNSPSHTTLGTAVTNSLGSGGSSSRASHQLSGTPNTPSHAIISAATVKPGNPSTDGDQNDQAPHQAGAEADTSGTSSPSDTSSIDQNLNPPNPIEILLDAALEAHLQLDAIVAGWAVLNEFWTGWGQRAEYDVSKLVFDLEEIESDDGRVARLRQISSQQHHGTVDTANPGAVPREERISSLSVDIV